MQSMDAFTRVYTPGRSVNDHSFLKAGDTWHLFHIWLDAEGDDVIGHATSRDLRHWTPQPDILPKGPPPSWESHPGGNAPYAFEWDGTYYLFYSRYDGRPHEGYFNRLFHDANQHIGVATSKDLFAWAKHPGNPIFHPAPFWCPWEDVESDQFRPHQCRDPHVMRIDDKFHLYYVAMTREPNVTAVGCAVSDDLIHWSDQGPVVTMPLTWRGTGTCESPGVVQAGRRWHLFFKWGEATQWAVSDSPMHFENPQPLCAAHAAEVFEADGRWRISSCGKGGIQLAQIDLSQSPPRISPLE